MQSKEISLRLSKDADLVLWLDDKNEIQDLEVISVETEQEISHSRDLITLANSWYSQNVSRLI